MPTIGENLYEFDHKMTPIFIMGKSGQTKPLSCLIFTCISCIHRKKTRRTISIIMSAVVTADKEITLGYLNFLLFASLYFLKFPQ